MNVVVMGLRVLVLGLRGTQTSLKTKTLKEKPLVANMLNTLNL
jgi:hypothetical protein